MARAPAIETRFELNYTDIVYKCTQDFHFFDARNFVRNSNNYDNSIYQISRGRAPKNAFFYTDRTIFSCG